MSKKLMNTQRLRSLHGGAYTKKNWCLRKKQSVKFNPAIKWRLCRRRVPPINRLMHLWKRKNHWKRITILGQFLNEGGEILRKGYEKGLAHHSIFLTNVTRKDLKKGEIDIVPVFFFETPRYYENVDVALISVLICSPRLKAWVWLPLVCHIPAI